MTTRTKIVALGVAATLAAGAVALALRSGPPEALGDLERAQQAGETARSRSADITDNLDRISANLRAGAGLGSKSAAIRALTERQRDSLTALVGLLRSQLGAIESSARIVGQTQTSTTNLARLSERQAEMVRRAVTALQRLRDLAAEAGALSADLARLAVYGARLAEDSQEAFSDP